MGREENIHRSSYSGGGGGGGSGGGGGEGGGNSSGRSKKVKQKKVPQRGLGVAQLEKIILEEEENKDVALQAANLLAKSIVSHSEANFRPNVSPPPHSISLAPPSPNDLPSPNSSYNLAQSFPNIEFLHPNSVQFSKSLNVGGGEIGMATISGSSWPKLWNGEYNLEGSDLQRFTIQPRKNFSYESNPTGVLPLLSAPQRVHPFELPASSLMVNASSGISSSSVLNIQMEPPSNQSYIGNNYRPFWPEEEKIVGIKRSYPFSMETPPAPSFQGNIHPRHLITISGSGESCSCSNGCTTQMEPSIKKYSREGPSTPNPLPERIPCEVIRENRELNGDFLTLAPPLAAASSSLLNQKHKNPFAYSGQQGQELSDFEYIRSQESAKDPSERLMERPPFNFFPSNVQIGQGTTYVVNGNGEKQEAIDLNLKL